MISRFVEHARAFVPSGKPDALLEWLPNGRTTVVFRALADGRKGDVAVLGPRTRALFKQPRGVTRVVVLQLKPGWSGSLLGVAANALANRIVLLEDLWGEAGSTLCAELLDEQRLPDAANVLCRAIAARIEQASESASARLARRAVRLLEADAVRVDRVADQLGVTSRHLRRAFHDNVGIGPKDFARTVRLQRAVRMTTGGATDWRRIATDAGYYDQAHLISDFRELVGVTPGAYLRRAIARTHELRPST